MPRVDFDEHVGHAVPHSTYRVKDPEQRSEHLARVDVLRERKARQLPDPPAIGARVVWLQGALLRRAVPRARSAAR